MVATLLNFSKIFLDGSGGEIGLSFPVWAYLRDPNSSSRRFTIVLPTRTFYKIKPVEMFLYQKDCGIICPNSSYII